jgi:hypothetical protein
MFMTEALVMTWKGWKRMRTLQGKGAAPIRD